MRRAVAARALLGIPRTEHAVRPPDRREHLHLVDAPHAECDRACAPAELTYGGWRILHERDDELRERDVEAVVGERQILCRSLVHLQSRKARAQYAGELGRRLGGDDAGAAVDECARQGAGAGADVEHPLPAGDTGELGEERREANRVTPHEGVVRISVVVKDTAHAAIESARCGCFKNSMSGFVQSRSPRPLSNSVSGSDRAMTTATPGESTLALREEASNAQASFRNTGPGHRLRH